MIIRKPYAFLIKYFKIIHVVMFIISSFLVFKIRNLYVFFGDYLKTGTFIYTDNILRQYISIPILISTIFIVSSLLLIYFLMKKKEKPSLFYIVSCCYYTLVFALFIYFQSIFANIEYTNYTNQSLVLFRDLWMVLYYSNFYFLIIFFIRAFGFNIKKFNFEKDIKELDISDEDREEIEVGSSFDYEKAGNIFRKLKRNFLYYIKENSYILTIFLVIIVLSFITYFSINRFVVNKIYYENQEIIVNDLNYTINKSYITNKDSIGNVINNDKHYLIVQFNVLNKTGAIRKISMQNTRFKMGDKYYYPLVTTSTKFKDLGVIYKEQYIKLNQDNNYILVFEIPNNMVKEIKNGILELYDNTTNDGKDYVYHYKNVKLNVSMFEEIDLGTFNLMESVDLEKTYYENGSFVINKYEFLAKDDYTYTKCSSDISDGECIEYKTSVVASPSKTLLKIEYMADISRDMFVNYLNIYYKSKDTLKIIKNSDIIDKTPDNYPKNYVLLEIDNRVNDEEILEFQFNIRGAKFKYKLK